MAELIIMTQEAVEVLKKAYRANLVTVEEVVYIIELFYTQRFDDYETRMNIVEARLAEHKMLRN